MSQTHIQAEPAVCGEVDANKRAGIHHHEGRTKHVGLANVGLIHIDNDNDTLPERIDDTIREQDNEKPEANATGVTLDEKLAMNQYPDIQDATSLMSKYLSPDVFQKLKNKKTSTGFTIARVVNTGVLNKDCSLVGCHAGDADSYTMFADFFGPLLDEYHGGFHTTDRHINDMDADHFRGGFTDTSTIISTRIRVARNISGFNLAPSQKSITEKLQIESLLKNVFLRFTGALYGAYYSLSDMTKQERDQLISDHLLFKENDRMQSDSGYHRWWPYGRGIYLNYDRTFAVWVNEGDHLRIISLQDGGDVVSVFRNLVIGCKIIEEGIKELEGRNFQRTDRLGMITCCPTNLGSGLRGSVLVKLAALAAKMGRDGLSTWCEIRGLQTRGFRGEHTESVDDTFDVSNKYRLGYSETELVQMMVYGVNELIALDNVYSAEI